MLCPKEKTVNLCTNISKTSDDDYYDPFYHKHICEATSIKQELDPELPYWCPENPVFIDAQTGLGKTTFVYQSLIPLAQERNQNLLLLSNRIALSVQQKRRLMEETDFSMRNMLNEEGIRQTQHFDNVCVITYQGIFAFLKKCQEDQAMRDWLKNVGFCVCDEAHYFVADAAFSSSTDAILKKVIQTFYNSIRVYMTATSFDVRQPLAEAEEKYYTNRELAYFHGPVKREFQYYSFPASYAFLSIHFVDSLDEMEDIIAGSKTKFVVFVDNKQEGKAFSDHLGNAQYLDADSRGSEAWNILLEKERFEEKVLVATSALDNGINIWDPEVHSIVICADSRTFCLQALGRKRRNKNEKVDLYLVRPSKQKISSRLQRCRKLISLRNQLEELPPNQHMGFAMARWDSEDASERVYFSLTNGGRNVKANSLGFWALEKRAKDYEAILSGERSFDDIALAWFGREKDTRSDETRLQLENFLESHLNIALEESECIALRRLIVDAMQSSGNREPQIKRINTLGPDALSNRLGALSLPYGISREWRISRITPEDEILS